MSNNDGNKRPRLPSSPLAIQAVMEMYDLRYNNPSMKENIFAEFIKQLYDPEKDTFNVRLWADTVGKFRSALNVVDNNDDKKILFVAPPVVGTVDTSTNPQANPLSRFSDHIDELTKRHPIAGSRAFEEGIKSFKPKGLISTRDAWRRILQRYGLIAKDVGDQNTSTDSSNSQDFTSFDDQYEEL